jgi:hypothetical protein
MTMIVDQIITNKATNLPFSQTNLKGIIKVKNGMNVDKPPDKQHSMNSINEY